MDWGLREGFGSIKSYFQALCEKKPKFDPQIKILKISPKSRLEQKLNFFKVWPGAPI